MSDISIDSPRLRARALPLSDTSLLTQFTYYNVYSQCRFTSTSNVNTHSRAREAPRTGRWPSSGQGHDR
jgi:hypothetical protein